MARRRSLILALAALFVLLFAGFAGGLLSIAPITGADTATHTADYHTWRGDGRLGPGRHELLDSPRYVGGFKSDSQSEIMVAQGGLSRFEASCVRPNNAVYRFWFRSQGATYPPANTFTPSSGVRDGNGNPVPTPLNFVLIKEDSVRIGTGGGCPDFLSGQASLSAIKGNYIGIVRVEFWVDFQDINYEGYHIMASDEANVQPGWGVISIENPDSLVQAGDDLRIHYDVGAACADNTDPGRSGAQCGWTLSLRNRENGATPAGWSDKSPKDFTSGTYVTRVQASWFAVGQRNEYEVKLFNQVNLQDAKIFVTIDDRNLAPPVPVVVVTPQPPYRQGQTISLMAHSEPNSVSKNSIKDYHIVVRQGDRILLDTKSVDGSANFVIADEQVDLQIEATAFDGQRTSGVHREVLTVLDADLDNNPPPGAPGGFPIPLWLTFVLIGAVALLISFLIPRGTIPFAIRIIIAMAGLLFLLLALVFY